MYIYKVIVGCGVFCERRDEKETLLDGKGCYILLGQVWLRYGWSGGYEKGWYIDMIVWMG
jgi:hypothetical protein